MLKNLPQGVKISITRSIQTAFEQYMSQIEWNEDRYQAEDFIRSWREYIEDHASWFERLSEEEKANPLFHQELADKINRTIEKIVNEEPTSEQIHQLNALLDEKGVQNITYSSKAEAKYWIDKLTAK
jgi:predicted ArsR family transcriptional regulator